VGVGRGSHCGRWPATVVWRYATSCPRTPTGPGKSGVGPSQETDRLWKSAENRPRGCLKRPLFQKHRLLRNLRRHAPFQALRDPDLDDTLPRPAKPPGFAIQRLHHPCREIDIHAPRLLQRAPVRSRSSTTLSPASNFSSNSLAFIQCNLILARSPHRDQPDLGLTVSHDGRSVVAGDRAHHQKTWFVHRAGRNRKQPLVEPQGLRHLLRRLWLCSIGTEPSAWPTSC